MTTRLAEVRRGGMVESIHMGAIAVVDVEGKLLAHAGDADLFAYYRSSAKPFQAVPLVESGAADRFGFTPAELALCCASHKGSPRHQQQVRAMLGKLGLDDGALRCGIMVPGDRQEAARVLGGMVEGSPLHCDCSGKHTGMIATCLQMGDPIEGYLDAEHPHQRRIRAAMAEVCRFPADGMKLAIDGCGVPTFGMPLRHFAVSWATLACPMDAPVRAGREHAAALNRLREAMVAVPFNVAGEGDLVTNVLELGKGTLVVKSGAEGLMCMGMPAHGIGVAIRIGDGSHRSLPVVVASVLEQLGLTDRSIVEGIRDRHNAEIRNHNGRIVGDVRAAFFLRRVA